MEKLNTLKGTQAEILKIGAHVLIPYIHNLFNIVVKHDLRNTSVLTPWY